jgi:3-methyladenine DNA glycosylase AlkC
MFINKITEENCRVLCPWDAKMYPVLKNNNNKKSVERDLPETEEGRGARVDEGIRVKK